MKSTTESGYKDKIILLLNESVLKLAVNSCEMCFQMNLIYAASFLFDTQPLLQCIQ